MIGKLAFGFVALMVVFCAFLMNVGLNIQRDMLQASSISYEQRIFVEYVGKRLLFLMKNMTRPDMSNHSINDIRRDIFELNLKINKNQKKLKLLLLDNDATVLLSDHYTNSSISENFDEVGRLLSIMSRRINEINNATLPTLKSAYNFWSPVDILLAQDGKLPAAMERLNAEINKASLEQNNLLYLLYGGLLVLMLVSVWLIWFFTLRPLAERLEKNDTEIRLKSETLAFQANHDSLTGLPNRAEFIRRMNQLHDEGGLLNRVALVLVDIDNFKSINDNYGHYAGDSALIEFAGHLAMGMPENEWLYRLSGDEFAIIISGAVDKKYLIKRAGLILANLRKKSKLFERDFPIHGSLGIAWGKHCGSTLQELFSAADMALYHVKDNGRNHFVFYDDISTLNISETLEIEQELYQAVENNEFTVFYQPVVDLDNNDITKLEALVRWQHPHRGVLVPRQWVSIAERLSIFSAINMQVFDIVERDYQAWQEEGLACPTIFINITESLLLSGMGFERITGLLEKSSSDVPWLGIEVTESVILDRSFNLARHQMNLMRDTGIQIALDDFGTGFANLSHLNTIPFDTIKIDRSFVSRVLSDESMYVIVESIITLVNKLKKEVVCEGVDNEAIKNTLHKMGCRFSQGFLHSHPLPFHEMTLLLRK